VDLTGDWDVRIRTPIGSLAIVYSFSDDDGIVGTATDDGDRLTGHSKAGRLPRSAVTGMNSVRAASRRRRRKP
jgi:hypothetical protein